MKRENHSAGRAFRLIDSELLGPAYFGDNCLVKRSSVGRYVGCGSFVRFLDCTVGAFSSIGDNVIIGAGHHELGFVSTSLFKFASANWLFFPEYKEAFVRAKANKEYYSWRKSTVVGADVWVGANSVICAGVNVGNGAVIGANSFVNRDVKDYEVVAGTPIRHIKFRLTARQRRELLASRWWELPIDVLLNLKFKEFDSFIGDLSKVTKARAKRGI